MTAKSEHTKGVWYRRLIQPSLSIKFLFATLGVLLLAACGGGSGSGQGSNSNITMSVFPQTVSVSAMTSQIAPSASVQVDVAGLSQTQEVYVGVSYTGSGIFNASVLPGSTLPATVALQFKSPASLGLGTYNDTVTINVCFDQSCSQPLSNSPQTVQVHYTVTPSTFLVSSLSPTAAYAGTQAFTLTVNGSTFTQQSTVLWNRTALPTTYISNTQLTAQVPAANIAASGSATVSVSDPTYGASNTKIFTINPSPLTITSLSPATINAGSPAFTLTITGTSFSQSVVMWNGIAQQTTFVSATQLTSQIPAANVATPGSATITVSDPTYGNSNSLAFTITPPPLALNSVSPPKVTVGGPSFTLTALGTAFTGTSTVEWNGTALATTLVSSTELIAQVPASDISTTGTASVMVSDPNSPPGTTSAQTVTIVPPSIDAVNYQMNPAHTGAVTFNSVSFPGSAAWSVNFPDRPSYALIMDGEVIVTVPILGFNSEMFALDQTTGNTVWGPIQVNGFTAAAYDNGRIFVVSTPIDSTSSVIAFNANTGLQEWSTPIPAAVSAPTAADGDVYVGGTNSVYALDESTGTVHWAQSVQSSSSSLPLAVTADGAYASYPCETYDFRPATGEIIWRYEGNGCVGGIGGTPVVANQLVYSPDEESSNVVDVFNSETGALSGSYTMNPVPAFTATMGYYVQSGTLYGELLSNKSVQWSFTGDGQLILAPIAVNQYVFIGSSSGNLYALDGTTGKLVWNVKLGSSIGVITAGDGLLLVPAGTTLTAFVLSASP